MEEGDEVGNEEPRVDESGEEHVPTPEANFTKQAEPVVKQETQASSAQPVGLSRLEAMKAKMKK
jgi:hypothetical protein